MYSCIHVYCLEYKDIVVGKSDTPEVGKSDTPEVGKRDTPEVGKSGTPEVCISAYVFL